MAKKSTFLVYSDFSKSSLAFSKSNITPFSPIQKLDTSMSKVKISSEYKPCLVDLTFSH